MFKKAAISGYYRDLICTITLQLTNIEVMIVCVVVKCGRYLTYGKRTIRGSWCFHFFFVCHPFLSVNKVSSNYASFCFVLLYCKTNRMGGSRLRSLIRNVGDLYASPQYKPKKKGTLNVICY